MNFRPIPHIILYIWTFTLAEAFFANIYGDYAYKTDYTHAEITEIGILKAVATFFEETPMNGNQPAPGSLTGIADITAKKLYDQVYGGTRSPKRLQEAIDQIIYFNNKVDLDHFYEAVWHFNGEQIEQANKKLQDLRYNILTELNKQTPDYVLTREWIGQFLHIMQMFYSNTNWADDNGNNKYPALGQPGVTLLQTAPPNMDTCTNCTQPCVMNYAPGIMKTYLTSGYKGGQDIQKPFKDPGTVTNGKCSHGGPLDNTSTTIAAIGGINKESSKAGLGPHYYFHTRAAEAAIDHTLYFFNDNPNGIRHVIPEINFKRLLQIDSGRSLVFVIDNSGSMASKLGTIVTETRGIIQAASSGSNPPGQYVLATFSDPVSTISVQTTDQSTTITNWIASTVLSGGDDCPEFSLTAIEQAANVSSKDSVMYVFTDSTPKDPYKEEKLNSIIADKRIQIYFIVTGTCSKNDPSGLKYSYNVPNATGRKRRSVKDDENQKVEKESDVEIRTALIKKAVLSPDDPPMFNILVDNSITEMTIQIEGQIAKPYIVIQKPNGDYLNINTKSSEHVQLTSNSAIFTIDRPKPGEWRIFRFDKSEWAIEVTGQSGIFFEYSISKESSQVISDKHIADTYEVSVSVYVNDNDTAVLDLLVINPDLMLDQRVALNRISENEYTCKLTNYQKGSTYGIEGLDVDGNIFQRYISSDMVSQDIQSRSRRSTSFDLMDVYRNLASVSGGHVYLTVESHIPQIATMFKESVSNTEVLLMKNVFPGGPSTTKEIHIEIDSSITRFTLNIHAKNDAPRFNLYDYRGNLQYLDNKTATIYKVDDTFYSIIVESPGAGSWALKKNDINEWDVEVTGKSTVDFSAKLMQYDPDSHSFYEFGGKPIPDENVTMSVELNDKTVVKDLSSISLLDVYGNEIAHYSLIPKESRHARAFYYTTVIIPHQQFKLAVIGVLPNGKPFVRMHRDVIETVNVKLEHKPETERFLMNTELNVTFVVTNAGSEDEDVKVTIKDDKNFVIGHQGKTFKLKAWSNQTGYFTLRGGPTKGEVTTITLTAKPAVATRSNSKFDEIITHLTVGEKPIDTTPPVCNVTTSSTPCNDPCKCQQLNSFITAEIWDEGDGLQEIKAPGAPSNAFHSIGFARGLIKQKGIVQAILVVDCCRKNASITVKDLKNLTGSCDIPIDPNYDSNACTTTTTTTMSTTTSANTTNTTSASSTAQSSVSSSVASSVPSSASSVPSSVSSSASSPSVTSVTNVSTSSSISTSLSSGSSTKSSTTTATPVSSISAGTNTNAVGNVTSSSAAQQSGVENSSGVSDGAAYGITAAVGGVTMAVTVGAVIYVIRKVLAGSPKTTPDNSDAT